MNGLSLKNKRIKKGLSQKDIANDLCVSIGAVSLWESDQRKIPRSIEKLFCLLYGFKFQKKNIYNDDSQPDLF